MSGVRLRESLLPGLGHVRRGFHRAGVRYLVYTLVWLGIVIGRFPALVDLAAAPGFENYLALLVLLVLPFVLVRMANRGLQALVQPPSKEGMGTWQLAWQALRKNPRGAWGLSLLGLIYLTAFLAPALAPYDPEKTPRDTIVIKFLRPGSKVFVFGSLQKGKGERPARAFRVEGDKVVLDRGKEIANPALRYKSYPASRLADHTSSDPKRQVPWRGWSVRRGTLKTLQVGDTQVSYHVDRYLMGTDENGRDLLTRIVYGSRISLSIGFFAMFVAVTLGVVFGSLSGYYGGFVDNAIMRVVDILLAFPRLLLLLLIVSAYENAGIFTVVVILGVTGWMGVSRLVRAQFLQIKSLDYAMAAKSFGFGTARVMFRHLLPNAMAPVIVNATLLVGNTILVEAALSFLGFGVQPPTPSWGNIISDGRNALTDAWWIATLPGMCIVATVVCVNLAGDALRDALDPRER